jgi:hypothetical protein
MLALSKGLGASRSAHYTQRRPSPDDQFSGNILDEAMRPFRLPMRIPVKASNIDPARSGEFRNGSVHSGRNRWGRPWAPIGVKSQAD